MFGKIDEYAGRLMNGWLVVIFLSLTAGLTGGNTFAAAPPDSGAMLQTVKPQQAEAPPENASDSLTITEPTATVPSGDKRTIRVNGFRFSGATIFSEKELAELVQDQAGKELTLDDLNRLTGKITAYLRQKGYLVAFAYIPAQRITGGIVTIAVLPGQYGETKIRNNAHISTARLQKMLSALQPGGLITKGPLERALLLLNDLAGLSVKATLTPGQTPGSADLILDVTDAVRVNGVLSADNWGNRNTGAEKAGVQIAINNFTYGGDSLNLSGMEGKGINNVSWAYGAPLGYDGLHLNLNYSFVYYVLGADFAGLGATGGAGVSRAALSYPFIRSRVFNLYGAVGCDQKQLADRISSIGTNTSRTSTSWHIGVNGNTTDTWGGGGVNSFSVLCYGGNLVFNDSAAATTDAAGANAGGGFWKTVLSYQRQQYIASPLSLNILFAGQLAGKNLDSSEKFSLGGADGVRAYPQGEGAGDQGLRLTAELKWRLPSRGNRENLYLTCFGDYGFVTINKNPWITATNSRSLADLGIGLIYTWTPGFYLRWDYAWKIGDTQSDGAGDSGGRCWIKVVKSF